MAGVVPLLATVPGSIVALLVLPGRSGAFTAAFVCGALVNATLIGWCSRALRRGNRPDPAP
jgi:hypothetical protein